MVKEKKGKWAFDGPLNGLRAIKLRKSVISKRLEAGRTIILDFKTKAQLLTIISGNEEKRGLTLHQIIPEGRNLRIAVIAEAFEPVVSVFVSTAEKPYKIVLDNEN